MAKGQKGFQKGNNLGVIGTQVRETKKEELWAFVAGGGLTKAQRILSNLLDAREVTEEEKQGLEFLLKFIPFTKAKKTEETVIIEDKRVILD